MKSNPNPPRATALCLLFACAGIDDALAAEESRFDQNMSLHPYFDFDVVRNVTARVGQTAFLNCRVEQLGDKSVIQSLRWQIQFSVDESVYGNAIFKFDND